MKSVHQISNALCSCEFRIVCEAQYTVEPRINEHQYSRKPHNKALLTVEFSHRK